MEQLKKVLNVSQMNAVDNYTIEQHNLLSIDLMEQAAFAFVEAFLKKEHATKRIIVVCGIGNNGGDGFAVCRLLKQKGIDASAFLVKSSDTLSKDCLRNKQRLESINGLCNSEVLPNFAAYDIIIDALFGSGLNKPIKGFAKEVIESMNLSQKKIYSIDVPSGLYCDKITQGEGIIKNSHVISFQRPKLAFFFPENSPFINSWEVVKIGLDESFIQSQKSDNYLLDEAVLKLVKSRAKQSHKGTYGHALMLAGSYGKIGAAVLTTKACLRSGVGLVTAYVPKCGYNIMQISIPEAMCMTDGNSNLLTTLPNIKGYDAMGVGPGIGMDELTVEFLKALLAKSDQPLVLDADAINILSANQTLLNQLPKHSVITPHIKEFDRLVGPSKNSIERHEKQITFSKQYKCVVVLKNANTCISSETGLLFFNSSGNQGMATAGSGDVLTGIITSLLAQKYDPLTAALVGVYFHGKAGDEAVKTRSYSALIASDIITHLKIESCK